MDRFTICETLLGPVGVAWRGASLVAVQLPYPTFEETEASIGTGRLRADPPEPITAVVASIRSHLAGNSVGYPGIEVCLDRATDFERQVYHHTRLVPSGQALTYGLMAKELGKPGSARAVGRALGRNPTPLIIPCHRILSASPGGGGFSAPGGLNTKTRLLALEGLDAGGKPLPGDLWNPQVREQAVVHLRGAGLGPVIDQVGPFTAAREHPDRPFAALAQGVLYQQLAGTAAAAIAGRLKAHFGGRFPNPDELLAATDEELRAAGISGPKSRALRELARAVVAGELNLDLLRLLPDEEVLREITAIRGLGPWTARMFLMFHLGRPDVLPTGDLGIRKAAALLFGWPALPKPGALERRCRPWRPYRTVASWYLWRSLGTVTLG